MPALRISFVELLRRDARGHNPDMPAYLFFPVALLVLMMASVLRFSGRFKPKRSRPIILFMARCRKLCWR